MIDNVEDLTKKVFNSDAQDILAFGKFCIEKESLRVSQSTISRQKHQESMGSPLCHRYITTDFSEAQLELITPPLIDKKKGLNFLENIHHFVSHKIEDEIIWPFSMPPFIKSDADIPIASYGSSNLALFKTAYRNGLSHRYGRTMQAIAGYRWAPLTKDSGVNVEVGTLHELMTNAPDNVNALKRTPWSVKKILSGFGTSSKKKI